MQAIGNGKVLPMDPRWKTALCWDWERDGRCSYANCSYAHGKQDLRGGMMADFRVRHLSQGLTACSAARGDTTTGLGWRAGSASEQ